MRFSTILPGLALASLTVNGCAPMASPATGGNGGDPIIANFTDQECQSATTAGGLGTAAAPHVCLALNALVASVTTSATPSALPITYPTAPEQYARFNAVLAASLRANPTGKFVEVTFTPNIDADGIRSLLPPYEPTPIQIWLQEVKTSGGKVCQADAPQSLIALLVFAVGDRLVKWLSSRAKAAAVKRALRTADGYNVVMYVTKPNANGSGGNKVPSLRFYPRSQPLTCDKPVI